MQVRYKREYESIIEDMVKGLKKLEDAYIFLGIDEVSWTRLGWNIQDECYKTMSHDIIYGLGFNDSLEVGKGFVRYDKVKAIIEICDSEECLHTVKLN